MTQITYWTSTSLLCLVLLWSAYTYFFTDSAIAGFRDLGFPDFFRVQLAILKLIAIAILLFPQTPLYVKEWAYAGIGLFFLTALVAHLAHKDGWGINLLLLVFMVLLAISRYYLPKT